MAELITMGSFVTASERQSAQVLRGLPEKWLVICNKEIVSPSATTYEVDFIVVADHTVFVVDEKSWRGAIYGNENIWILSGSEPRPNPLQKINHVARQLAGMLRGRIPFLHNLPSSTHFVHPVVLMSDPGVELRILDPRVGNQVVRLADALDELPRLDKELDQVKLEPARDKLRLELSDLKNRPQFPQSINSYTVKEVLPGGPRYRAFIAEHRGGAKRLLKLYEIDRDLQPRNFLEREYYAVLNASREHVSPSVDPFFFWGDEQYMAIPFHLPEGQALRNPASAERLRTPQHALGLVVAAYEALKRLHSCGIVHRWITPDRVFVRAPSSSHKVEFFDFAFCHIDQQQSIAAELDALQLEDSFLAPECKVSFSFAAKASDVYGLALSLCVHLTDQEPSGEELSASSRPKWVDASIRGAAPHWPAVFLKSFIVLLQSCVQEDERQRPTPEEVIETDRPLLKRWEASVEQPRPDNPQTLGQGQYRVIRQLGSGATALTFLVEDTFIGGMYVLKRIRNQALAQRLAGAEFRALKDLHHTNLPRVYDVRPADQDFQLKLEYIPGCTLDTAWDQYREQIGPWLLLARSLLRALAYLEEHGILHRDLSARNIIVPDEDQGRICLIDFGLARLREEQSQSAVGTPLYRAPEAARGVWNASSDVYSAGVILFKAITGTLPFPLINDEPSKEIEAPLPVDLEARLGRRLIQVLRRAVGPADIRYGSAQAFLDEIEAAMATPEADVVSEGTEVRLEWVRQVRGLYRNSATGNRDNRGLESPFVREIYVPTLLDSALLPEVLLGRKRLVFLTGNPGDGKTAFLGKVRDRLESLGGTPHHESRYGWDWTLNGIRFKSVYDASESQEDGRKHADQVLREALEPFQGQSQPDLSTCPVVLIAINDGRLHEFCELQRDRFPPCQ
jgi:serine/threonine protein kinase